jgi:DNA polymerase-3 subunit chi
LEPEDQPSQPVGAGPRIDFYALSDATPEARLQLACRLVEKAYHLGHRVYVHVGTQERARRLDDLLWTFRAGSFLPHALLREAPTDDEPIWIGFDTEACPSGEVLVNLADAVPPFYGSFQRVVEVVGHSEAERLGARERYRIYRERGHSPHTHRLSSAAAG